MGGELGVPTAATCGVSHHPVDARPGAMRSVIEHSLQLLGCVRLDRKEIETGQPVAFLRVPVRLPFEHPRQNLR